MAIRDLSKVDPHKGKVDAARAKAASRAKIAGAVSDAVSNVASGAIKKKKKNNGEGFSGAYGGE